MLNTTRSLSNVFAQSILIASFANHLIAGDKLENLPESHARKGWPNFFSKIERGEDITIAFIGGSITAQPGWRPKILEHFKQSYPEIKFTEINACITGTNSYLGVSRIQRDILDHDPDLIFIEFAVNDADGAFSEKTFEGMVRKALANEIATDICFVYTATIKQVNHLLEGRYQPSAQAMEDVANHYGIPSIHLVVQVARLLQAGKLEFVAPLPKDGSGSINGKIVFSPDGAHPYPETGHELYVEAIKRALPSINNASTNARQEIPTPLNDNHWQDVKLIPLVDVTLSPGWKKLSPQDNSIAEQFTRFLPAIWMAEEPHASIEFTFHGSAVGLYGVKGPDVGGLLVQIDDQEQFAKTFFYVSSNPYGHFLKP
ncbi:MAG: SGNH/GDSL hydrolase family protein, partial [Planctomycetes bacterium]|nr:SGNH/GDSL hydrolase family protein [Planctomycetota bacterium]